MTREVAPAGARIRVGSVAGTTPRAGQGREVTQTPKKLRKKNTCLQLAAAPGAVGLLAHSGTWDNARIIQTLGIMELISPLDAVMLNKPGP